MADKKVMNDSELLNSIGFSKTTEGYSSFMEKYQQNKNAPKDFSTWDPMKEDFKDDMFNSYDRGPGRNLIKDKSKNLGGTEKEMIELYVTGIPDGIDQTGLQNMFEQCGDVVKAVKIPRKLDSRFEGSIGFIGYKTTGEAVEAISKLNDRKFCGGKNVLKVKFALSEAEKRERDQQKQKHALGIPDSLHPNEEEEDDEIVAINSGAFAISTDNSEQKSDDERNEVPMPSLGRGKPIEEKEKHIGVKDSGHSSGYDSSGAPSPAHSLTSLNTDTSLSRRCVNEMVESGEYKQSQGQQQSSQQSPSTDQPDQRKYHVQSGSYRGGTGAIRGGLRGRGTGRAPVRSSTMVNKPNQGISKDCANFQRCKMQGAFKCKVCKQLYCSVTCQEEDWPRHKLICQQSPCVFWRIYGYCHKGVSCEAHATHTPANRRVESHRMIYAYQDGLQQPINGDECYYWRLFGMCVYDKDCFYRHDYRSQGIDMECLHWRIGNCTFGGNCRLKHVSKHLGVDGDSYNVPECRHWRFKGCDHGTECSFLHLKESKGIDYKEVMERIERKKKGRETKNELEGDEKDSSAKRIVLMSESNKTSEASSHPTSKDRRFKEDALKEKKMIDDCKTGEEAFEKRFELDFDLPEEFKAVKEEKPATDSWSRLQKESKPSEPRKSCDQHSTQSVKSPDVTHPMSHGDNLKSPESRLYAQQQNKPTSAKPTSTLPAKKPETLPKVKTTTESSATAKSAVVDKGGGDGPRGRVKIDSLGQAKIVKGELPEVIVTAFENPNHFWVAIHESVTKGVIQQNHDLKEAYCHSEYKGYTPEVKEVIVSQFEEDNGWYRAVVNGINLDGTLRVNYVDFGNSEEVHVNRIRKLDPKFTTLPIQAIKCKLPVEPVGASWPAECLELCKTELMPLLTGKTMIATFIKEEDKALCIDLVDLPNEMAVSDQLVEKGFAKRTHGKDGGIKSKDTSSTGKTGPNNAKAAKSTDPASSIPANLSGVQGPNKSLTEQKESGVVLKKIEGIPPPPPIKGLPFTNPPCAAKWMNEGKTYTIKIVEIISPSQFWIHVDMEELHEVKLIQAELKKHYSRMPLKKDFKFTGNQLYACKFSEDQEWYRACAYDADPSKVSVFYLDFGNFEYVPVNALHPLEGQFLKLPFQAVCCRLGAIKAADNEKWSNEAIEFFRKQADRELKCQVLKKDSHMLHVEILNSQGKSLNEAFVRKGYAIKESSEKTSVAKSDEKVATMSKVQESSYPTLKDLKNADLGDKTEFEMQVSDAQSLNSFVVQVSETGPLKDQLIALSEKLANIHHNYTGSYMPSHVGELVCAQFMQEWFRAEVLELQQKTAKVQFIDYGNVDTVETKSMCKFDPSLLQYPVLGLKCTLAGVGGLATDRTWDPNIFMPLERIWCMKVCGRRGNLLVIEMSDPQSGASMAEALLEDKMVVSESIQGVNPENTSQQQVTAVEQEKQVPAAPSTTEVQQSSHDILMLSDIKEMDIGDGNEFIGYVTDATSPSRVVLHLTTPGLAETTAQLQNQLQKLHSSYNGSYSPKMVGELVCAQYDVDKVWYRAVVLEIKPKEIKVEFVDYGNTETVNTKQLCAMDKSLLKYPSLAIHCSMSGIKCPSETHPWDAQRLHPQMEPWKIKVVSRSQDLQTKRLHLSIDIIHINSGESLNRSFIEKGFVISEEHTADPMTQQSAGGDDESSVTIADIVSKCIIQPYKLGADDAQHNVQLVHYVGPNEFYVQCHDDKELLKKAISLMNEINVRYGDSTTIYNPSVGEVVIVFNTEYQEWYRAVVLQVIGEKALMFYIDFGNVGESEILYVRKIEKRFTTLPGLAVKCSLFGLTEDSIRWPGVAIQQMSEMLKGSLLIISVSDVMGGVAVINKIIRQEDNVDIVQSLLKEGYVKPEVLGDKKKERNSSSASRNALMSPPPQLEPIEPTSHLPELEPIDSPKTSRVMAKDIPSQDSHFADGSPVTVCHFESLDALYLQKQDLAANQQLDQINREILQGKNTQVYAPKLVGEAVVVNFMDYWCRGEVIEIDGDNFKIDFFDYGNTYITTSDNIRRLDQQYKDLPKQAVCCCFSGIQGNLENQQWSNDSEMWFKANVHERSFKVKLNGEAGDSLIQRIDLVNEENQSLSEIMIEKGLAIPKPASKPVHRQTDQHHKAPKVLKHGASGSITSPPPAQRVITSPKRPVYKMTDMDGLPQLPKTCQVVVCDISSPTQFVCQHLKSEDAVGLAELLKEMVTYCEQTPADPTLQLNVGDLCCAQYSMDQDWYRGEVTEVLSASQVTVYFMDYGNSEKQDMANIRPFKDDYTKRKALGIKCALAGLPPNVTEFPLQVTQEFQALVLDKDSKCEVVEKRGDVNYVKLVTTGNDVGTCVNDAIVDLLNSLAPPTNPVEESDEEIKKQIEELQKKLKQKVAK